MSTLLVGVSATAGCGSHTANSPAPATAASPVDDESAGLMEHHRYHHHGGLTLFIAMSLDTLGVSPEQRAAIESIRRQLHAEMEPVRVAEQSLVATLADELAASTFDSGKVDEALAGVTRSATGVPGATIDALTKLHAALTPAERAALVDKVAAHWAVWERVNADETDAANIVPDGHLGTLETELGLTADQAAKIRGALANEMKTVPRLDRQEIANRLRPFADAFRADVFDPNTVQWVAAANVRMVDWGAAHLARVVEALGPVLNQDQRSQLEQKLREHATHNPNAQDQS